MRKSFVLFVLVSFAIILIFPTKVVKAEEQKYGSTSCAGGTGTLLLSTDELKVVSFEARGVTRSNIEGSPFGPEASYYGIGITRIAPENKTATGHTVVTDEGGTRIYEFTTVNNEGTHTLVDGTGKYKGMKAKGTHKVFPTKAPVKGSVHYCVESTGTAEMATK